MYGRKTIVGDIIAGEMQHNDAGSMIFNVLKNLPQRYFGFDVDSFVVMPDHVHVVIIIEGGNGRTRRSAPTVDSLSDVIKKIKTYSTICYMQGVYRKNWAPFHQKLWQRGFYEHIIRNNASLEKIREYIIKNPLQWEIDLGNLN